jgi:hypothetical protein
MHDVVTADLTGWRRDWNDQLTGSDAGCAK